MKGIKGDNSKNYGRRWISGNRLSRFKKAEIKKYCIQERIGSYKYIHKQKGTFRKIKKLFLEIKNMTAEMENRKLGR